MTIAVPALVTQLYPAILSANAEPLAADFSATPVLDTPRTGALVGHAEYRRFVRDEQRWLHSLGVETHSLKPVRTTQDSARVVHELAFTTLDARGRLPHKLAVVADRVESKVSALRVYYSYSTLAGDMTFLRPAMLLHDPSCEGRVPISVRRYLDAIAAADAAAWQLFAPGATFTGFNNLPLSGELLLRFYAVLAGEAGGVPLKPTTVTTDAAACAIEENLASWGQLQFSQNTAGLAVYEYDARRGLLTAARVYDDIPDTPFTHPGWMHRNWARIRATLEQFGCSLAYQPDPADPPETVLLAYFTAPRC